MATAIMDGQCNFIYPKTTKSKDCISWNYFHHI